jgi:hypothetical protein
MLQPAKFREQHASLNALLPQLLFDVIIPDSIAAPGDLYAIILHCADWKDTDGVHPGFLKLGIPSQDGSRWEQDFDFSEILAAYPHVRSVEEGEPSVRVKWKRRATSAEV